MKFISEIFRRRFICIEDLNVLLKNLDKAETLGIFRYIQLEYKMKMRTKRELIRAYYTGGIKIIKVMLIPFVQKTKTWKMFIIFFQVFRTILQANTGFNNDKVQEDIIQKNC